MNLKESWCLEFCHQFFQASPEDVSQGEAEAGVVHPIWKKSSCHKLTMIYFFLFSKSYRPQPQRQWNTWNTLFWGLTRSISVLPFDTERLSWILNRWGLLKWVVPKFQHVESPSAGSNAAAAQCKTQWCRLARQTRKRPPLESFYLRWTVFSDFCEDNRISIEQNGAIGNMHHMFGEFSGQ